MKCNNNRSVPNPKLQGLTTEAVFGIAPQREARARLSRSGNQDAGLRFLKRDQVPPLTSEMPQRVARPLVASASRFGGIRFLKSNHPIPKPFLVSDISLLTSGAPRSNTKIVTMQEPHIVTLVELEKLCFSTPWSFSALKNELGKKGSWFFVATNNFEQVLGYIGMYSVLDENYITNLAVFPQYRNQGIAKCLIKTLINQAITNRSKFISLEVRASNKPAISLYKSQGFIKAGSRKNFYSLPTEDANIMTKQLIIDCI